jgi:hypothetical protein
MCDQCKDNVSRALQFPLNKRLKSDSSFGSGSFSFGFGNNFYKYLIAFLAFTAIVCMTSIPSISSN